MKIRLLLPMIVIILSTNNSFTQSHSKEIVGYYPNWQWYDRDKLVKPQTINYSNYTIINYCFMKPEADGSISLTDAWADENLLLGEPDWQNGGYLPNTSIIELAHNNGLLVLPSIGGWTLSSNFPAIASDVAKRAVFVQACVELIQTYNFDGIDIDWEYPGYAPHGGTPQDKENFSMLLKEIRTAIDNYGLTIGKTMLLTAAVGAAESNMAEINWPIVSQYLDIINLMSYDFFGAFSPITNHNAPLFKPAQGNPDYNVDSAVTKLVSKYGVSPDKITLGVAFLEGQAKQPTILDYMFQQQVMLMMLLFR
jgi:GH18 family chitinase